MRFILSNPRVYTGVVIYAAKGPNPADCYISGFSVTTSPGPGGTGTTAVGSSTNSPTGVVTLVTVPTVPLPSVTGRLPTTNFGGTCEEDGKNHV